MIIPVKNMVCDRCVKAVNRILNEAGVKDHIVRLGSAEIRDGISESQQRQVRDALLAEGFEWIDNQRLKLAEAIKQEIVQLVHYGELDEMRQNLSDYLAGRLHKEYSYLSSTFSSIESTTIEQYFILQKIEKVKEWLVYNEMTLSEMAIKLGYSSTAHLSAQFKKITGFTPSQFRELKDHHRKPIDRI